MVMMTLRVRSQIGTWRVNNVSSNDSFQELKERLQKEHGADFTRPQFSKDASGKELLKDTMLVSEAGLKNGDMIYADVDEYKVGIHEASTAKKMITKDGKIVAQDMERAINATGFRPGMLPLRSMKMQWTLNEFISLDEQFVYKIKAQEKSICTVATLNTTPLQEFQSYMRSYDFRMIRVAYLYGRFEENNAVKVEVLYEPPQEATDVSFTLLDDPKAHVVNDIAHRLGLQKVGWVFAHPPREKGFHFSAPEVMFAAEQQLEAARGIEDTPFVTVKITLDDKNQMVVEAFQVSKQCMEMVAEGVLKVSTHLGSCNVHPTFTAVVEGRNATEIDNNFFLCTVPIKQFESQFLVSMFPRGNRVDFTQSRDDIKRQLSNVGKRGWSFTDMIADFELLVYLSSYLGLSDDIPLLCNAVMNRDIPLDEGYQILLRSMAGMD